MITLRSLSVVNIVKQTFRLIFKKSLFLLIPFLWLWALTFVASLFILNYDSPFTLITSWSMSSFSWMRLFTVIFVILTVLITIFIGNITLIATYKLAKWETFDRKYLLEESKQKYLWILGISALQWIVFIVPAMLFGFLSVVIPFLGFFIAVAWVVFGIIAFTRLLFADYYYLFKWKNFKESLQESSNFVKKIGWWDIFWKYIGLSIAFFLITFVRYFILVPQFSSLMLAVWSWKWTLIITFISQLVKYLYYPLLMIAWTLVYIFYSEKQKNWSAEIVEAEKEKFWCFFYGCIWSLVLMVLWTVSMIFAINRFVKYAIQNYTTSQIMALPTVSLNTWDLVSWLQKFETLQNMVTFNSWSSIAISENDLNAIVYSMNSWNVITGENFLNYLNFKIQSWELDSYFSLPLGKLPFAMLKWRYLNWYFTFTINPSNIYPVFVKLLDWEVNWKKLPDTILEQVKDANLLQSMYQQSYKYPQIQNIKSAKIDENNQILIEVFGEESLTWSRE